VDELVEWNNVDPDAKLHPKLVLQLYVRKDFDRAGVALLDPGKVRAVTLGSEEFLALEAARRGKTRLQYVARPGDTLAKIARRYGLQPGDLARINKLSYSSELAEGQRIFVYSPTPELPREIAVGRSAPHRRPAGAAEKTGRAGAKPEATAKPTARTAPAKVATGKSPAKKTEAKTEVKAPPARTARPVPTGKK
jgi:LysM repeat protein